MTSQKGRSSILSSIPEFRADAFSTQRSRSHHDHAVRSSGEIPPQQHWAPLKELINPKSTLRFASVWRRCANSRFLRRRRTRGPTAPRFRPTSPPWNSPSEYQREEVRFVDEDAENGADSTPGGVFADFRFRASLNNASSDFLTPLNPMTKSVTSLKFRPEVRQTARQRRSS